MLYFVFFADLRKACGESIITHSIYVSFLVSVGVNGGGGGSVFAKEN